MLVLPGRVSVLERQVAGVHPDVAGDADAGLWVVGPRHAVHVAAQPERAALDAASLPFRIRRWRQTLHGANGLRLVLLDWRGRGQRFVSFTFRALRRLYARPRVSVGIVVVPRGACWGVVLGSNRSGPQQRKSGKYAQKPSP